MNILREILLIGVLVAVLYFFGIPWYKNQTAKNFTETKFLFSEGSCKFQKDCSYAGDGCGGGHGVCTNVPKNHENDTSICNINAEHPINNGFECACINSKCGWGK
ncbi:MAG: hypothetical protein EXS49_00440 [Candidatus Pacebacteria bacterium]|nr:hypothetical protein [Candidatus Paceibacterota bacterium]